MYKSIHQPSQTNYDKTITLPLFNKWIFCWVRETLRLIVSDILYAEILEHFEESFADMVERNSSVVWITLLDEYVTIESSHFLNSEDTDTSERASRNIENLTLSDV